MGTVVPDVIDSSCTMVKTSGADKQLEFLNKNAQLIKAKSVSEAVEVLQAEYNAMEKEVIFFDGIETIKFVVDKANLIPVVPENELKLLKIMNLSYMLGLDLSLGTNYMEKTGEILLNDDIEYQRTKYRSLKALSESSGK
ncbi:Uncharacterised protein [Sebaldella termitidis]|nr:Uncharacterised protein [Sebaldella termitidis]